MWLIGHTASAYIVIKCLWLILKPNLRKGTISKVNSTFLKPNINSQLPYFPPHFLLLLFIFANWPDFFHVPGLRILSHNFIAVVTIPLIVLIILIHIHVINRVEAVLLLFASVLHMLTDVSFSSFHLLYPFKDTIFSIYPFNGPEDIIAESIITIIFLILFLWTKDWEKLSNFLSNNLYIASKKDKSIINLLSENYIFIFMIFSLFALIQLLMNIRRLLVPNSMGEWYRILFTVLFSIFIGLLTIVLLKSTFYAQRRFQMNAEKSQG